MELAPGDPCVRHVRSIRPVQAVADRWRASPQASWPSVSPPSWPSVSPPSWPSVSPPSSPSVSPAAVVRVAPRRFRGHRRRWSWQHRTPPADRSPPRRTRQRRCARVWDHRCRGGRERQGSGDPLPDCRRRCAARCLRAFRRCRVHRRPLDPRRSRLERPTSCSRRSSTPGRPPRRFNPDQELAPWLYTIARRQAIDAYRRERRARAVDAAELDDAQAAVSLEATWEAWQVRLALEQLPDDERQVVRLSWFDGLAHPEIADKLGVPVGTVKSRSHRAHRRLADLLAHVRDVGEPPATHRREPNGDARRRDR